jgi:mannose-1-phosphate guanylyltransferase
MIRQAGILCAGLGTRLRPFTDKAPKPMLPLLGVPMIEWNIRRFRQFGVMDYFITAGGIKSFEDQLDEEFFLMYGDIFSNVDYGAMERAWRQKPGALGMQTMKLATNYADADVAELDGEGRVTAVHPKPHTSVYTNAYRMRGIFILRREILNDVPVGEYFEIGNHLLPAVVAKGEPFWGYVCSDYSKGIDTLEKWKEVEEHVRGNGFAGDCKSVENC